MAKIMPLYLLSIRMRGYKPVYPLRGAGNNALSGLNQAADYAGGHDFNTREMNHES